MTALTPPGGATGVGTTTAVTASFSEALNPSTLSGATFALTGPGGATVAATVAYAAGTSATLTPASPLAASTTYTITVVGGPNGVTDPAGNALAANVTSSFTTAAPSPAGCPCTIWTPTTTPTVVSAGDNQAVELGVKFRSDLAGVVTGLRFYKGSANTGTHIGNLWTSTGSCSARSPSRTRRDPAGSRRASRTPIRLPPTRHTSLPTAPPSASMPPTVPTSHREGPTVLRSTPLATA